MTTRDPTEVATVPGKPTGAVGPTIGERWGRYRLVAQLGAGGMGTVFAAHDPELDREVALKVIHDEHLGLAAQERLRREARAMAKVAHPNVVPVYEVGEHAGRTYYTMERVRGRSLASWLAKRPPWRDSVRLFVEAGRGLAAIHAAGMAHRDVKPGNILVGDDGRARITDFGIATSDASAPTPAPALQHTMTIHNAGTPAYMAPEQIRGDTGDAASDQFAFGLTLIEALTGKRPFPGDTAEARLAAIEQGPPVLPPSVPRWLAAIARRAVAANPAERFAGVQAIVDALEHPPRRWLPVALGGAGLAAAGAIAALLGSRSAVPACDGGAERLGDAWDANARARVETALAAIGLPYAASTAAAVTRGLDAYAASWIATHGEACRATRVHGEQPEQVMNARFACLDARRADLRALVALLSSPDVAMVRGAPKALGTLSPTADCMSAVTQRPTAAADELIARGLAQLAIGHFTEAKAAATDAIATARTAKDRRAMAEASLVKGRSELAAGEPLVAIESLTASAADADTTEAVRVRIAAWAYLSTALQELGRLDEADRTIELAQAAVKTAAAREQEVLVLSVKGTLLGRRGRYEEARSYFLRSLEVARSVYGADSSMLAVTFQNLTTAERRLGHLDAALDYATRSVQLAASFGESHPDVARSRRTLGVVYSDLRRYEEARRELEGALAIYTREADEAHVADLEQELGVVASRQRKSRDAIQHLRAAIAIYDKRGTGTRSVWNARTNLATSLIDVGDLDGAEPVLREILGVPPDGAGPDHSDVANAHFMLSFVLASRRAFDDAVAELEAARRIFETSSSPTDPSVARVLSARASIERDRGGPAAPRIARDFDARALAILEAALPAGHDDITASRLALADDHLLGGDHRGAVPLAETVVGELERSKSSSRVLAWIVLADALWGRNLGDDRTRARELAARAHDAATTTVSVDAELRDRIERALARMR